MANFIKQKTITLVMNNIANYTLIAFILALALFYAYFANAAVRTLTILEKNKQQIQSLSVLVSEIESEHLAVENSISPEKAWQLGFVEVNNPTFIMKNSKKTALSFKTE